GLAAIGRNSGSTSRARSSHASRSAGVAGITRITAPALQVAIDAITQPPQRLLVAAPALQHLYPQLKVHARVAKRLHLGSPLLAGRPQQPPLPAAESPPV